LRLKIAGLQSIAVTLNKSSTKDKSVQQFAATGTYDDSSIQDITSFASWSSSNVIVATIDDSAKPGMVIARKLGLTNITATLEEITSPVYTLTTASCDCLDYNDNLFPGPNMRAMSDCWAYCCVDGDGRYRAIKFGKYDNLCRL